MWHIKGNGQGSRLSVHLCLQSGERSQGGKVLLGAVSALCATPGCLQLNTAHPDPTYGLNHTITVNSSPWSTPGRGFLKAGPVFNSEWSCWCPCSHTRSGPLLPFPSPVWTWWTPHCFWKECSGTLQTSPCIGQAGWERSPQVRLGFSGGHFWSTHSDSPLALWPNNSLEIPVFFKTKTIYLEGYDRSDFLIKNGIQRYCKWPVWTWKQAYFLFSRALLVNVSLSSLFLH